jgi:hypothetical protein
MPTKKALNVRLRGVKDDKDNNKTVIGPTKLLTRPLDRGPKNKD